MAAGVPDAMDSFESWLLRRVAEAVEAELKTSREKPPEQGRADAVRDLAVELQMPTEKVEAGFAAFEAQPRVIREVLMRRIAAAWLEAQRKAYRQQHETR